MLVVPDLACPPSHLWVPDHVSTAGEEAGDLARSIGLDPDPEQQLALDSILAERPDGKWAAFEGAVVAPRQNLKTYLFLIIALTDLFVLGTKLIVWTAHEYSTSGEAFLLVKEYLENFDHLRRRVKKVTDQNGEEGITLVNGQRLRFKARTKTGGRGLTGDRVVLDEAFALQPSHMGSLMPTMSAKTITGNPQILYGSSSGLLASAVLRTIRNRGRAGDDPFLAYLEWSAAELPCADPDCTHVFGTEGCMLDDEELWWASNLALGRRISIDFLRMERRSLPPEEFAREILGWWEDPPAGDGVWGVFDPADWAHCEDLQHKATGPLRYALDVDSNAGGEEWASVMVSDGVHIEDVSPPDAGPGVGWVVLEAKRHRVAIGDLLVDPSGPAGKLIGPLEKAGVGIEKVTGQEFNQACMHLQSQVASRLVRHIGQPKVNRAVAGVVRRDIGDGAFRFSRNLSAVEISSVNGGAMACWAADKTKPYTGPLVAVT